MDTQEEMRGETEQRGWVVFSASSGNKFRSLDSKDCLRIDGYAKD